jgi:spore germination cell wall hydrolase CwlJ-like protein
MCKNMMFLGMLLSVTSCVVESNDHNPQSLPDTKQQTQIELSSADKEEINCLAQNLYFEARNQRPIGMIAIGYLVKNRVTHSRWPNTMCKVIWQHRTIRGRKRSQFSWTNDGLSDVPKELNAWKKAKSIAKNIYRELVPNPIGVADHYHTTTVNPIWSRNMYKVATIGDHIFFDSSKSATTIIIASKD